MAVRYRSASGVPLISVTQVLTLAGRIESQWFTPESAARGSAVHALTELVDDDVLFVNPVELDGYVAAYRTFLRDCHPVYAGSEVKVMNPLLGLAGRIDRICDDLFGWPGILDFKTGEPQAWHAQQLSFYNWLHPTGARWGCYLSADGRYRLRQYDDPADHRLNMYDLARVRGTVTADGDYWIGNV